MKAKCKLPDVCAHGRCNRKVFANGLCTTHSRRQHKLNNPTRYAYQTLKDNAKRRGKEFDLTFEQFKKFALKTQYLHKKGRGRYSYTIDRIDSSKGYTLDNIQVLTNRQNVLKMHTERMCIEGQYEIYSYYSAPPCKDLTKNSNVPF